MTKLETGLVIGIVVIVVASLGTLFGGGTYIKNLQLKFEGSTEKQAKLQESFDSLTDSIVNRVGKYSALEEVKQAAKDDRKKSEAGLPKIKEDYEEAINRIAADDVYTDFSSVTDVYRQHKAVLSN